MSKLKWGMMTVEIAKIANGTPEEFKKLETPVQGTFALNVEEGNKLEAFIEGGERIDVKKEKNKYAFEFELYIGEGMPKPIEDEDGLIANEYAIRVTPADNSLQGFLMERAAVSVTETMDSATGHKAKYRFDALKPTDGELVKPYTVGA